MIVNKIHLKKQLFNTILIFFVSFRTKQLGTHILITINIVLKYLWLLILSYKYYL